MNTHLKSLVSLALLAGSTLACDEIKDRVEDSLNGEAAPLKEADLPNCSKVINCCANIESRGLSDSVTAACNDQLVPAVNGVIDTYQSAKAELQDVESVDNEEALAELTSNTQETAEPACRCFLEETVGTINTETIDLLPVDCEVDTSTGALSDGQMCSEVVDSLTGG